MKIKARDFRASEGKKVDLSSAPTSIRSLYRSKQDYERLLEEQKDRLRELQEIHYVRDEHSLLIIFQAMDAAGKDGAIKHVMSGLNPQGCQVFSFRHPTPVELDHDFLWRAALSLPERGRIGIFNRSYYEEVLIVRVHPEILRAQALPAELKRAKSVWQGRYKSIRDFEEHLTRNGTHIVKFFLHISKDEQRTRLLARMNDPSKHWKVNAADVNERKLWDAYMRAYEACMENTSTAASPWYIIPADDKKNARLIIAHVLAESLAAMSSALPELSAAKKAEIGALRARLEAE